MKREHLPDLLLATLVAIVVVYALSDTVADADLWGHVRFGQDILAANAIPRHDPYSFTSDRTWVNHEWLAEVLMAATYGIAGSGGLITLKWMLSTAAFVVVWGTLRSAGVFRPFAVALLLVAIPGTYGLMMTVRPQLFSMLLYTLLLALLNGIGRGRWRLLLWIPLIFVLWANLHGGWIVGLGVLGLWSGCAFLARSIPWRWAAAGIILGGLGTLATPYGFELWRFLWQTVGLGRADIREWQPLTREPYLLAPWVLSAALMLVAWRRRGMSAVALLIPAAALGALSLRVARLEGFFTLTTVLLLAPCFAAIGPQCLPLSKRPTRTDVALVLAICLTGLTCVGAVVNNRVRCLSIERPDLKEWWAPEAEAVVFLTSNVIRGRLLSYFDYGELAIWHLAPKVLVSYDGRRETVYSSEVQHSHTRFYASSSDAEYARTLDADYIWLPRRLPVNTVLERDGWLAIFTGPRSVIYSRRAGSYRQPLAWTGPRCFPGP